MKIYAHRGASANAPENTMVAFRAAHSMGAHGIELDVQMSADGELVVIHDHTLTRTSNGNGRVEDHTLVELQQLDFGGWFSPVYQGERIATLHEVLSFMAEAGMELNIELKTYPMKYDARIPLHTVEMVRSFDLMDKVILSSFDHRSLLDAKRRDARIKIGLLYSANFIGVGDYARKLDAEFVHPYYAYVDQTELQGCKRNGVSVNTWTVDEIAIAEKLREMGVTILITNKPDIMMPVVCG